MNNEELYQKALDAITELFSDKTVSVLDAAANLNALKDEIDQMLDSLPE